MKTTILYKSKNNTIKARVTEVEGEMTSGMLTIPVFTYRTETKERKPFAHWKTIYLSRPCYTSEKNGYRLTAYKAYTKVLGIN